jgi:hypothetical protein
MSADRLLVDPGGDEDNLTAGIDRLAPHDLHVQHGLIEGEITEHRARLNLLLNSAVQQEVARIGEFEGTEGILVIASVAGVSDTSLWDLLAGRYRPTPEVWQRIERIFMMCRASHKGTAAVEARRHFEQVVALTRARELILGRLPSVRRRTGPYQRNGNEAAGTDHQTPAEIPALNQAKVRVVAEPEIAPPIPDLLGHDQSPNPMQAKTPAQFVAAMNAYRVWAGNPSLRELERRCAKKISYSTFRNMLSKPALPKLAALETFVRALGGASDDLQRWATAWRKLMKDATPLAKGGC